MFIFSSESILIKNVEDVDQFFYNISRLPHLHIIIWDQRTTAGLSAGTVSATEGASGWALAKNNSTMDIRIELVEQFFPINLN